MAEVSQIHTLHKLKGCGSINSALLYSLCVKGWIDGCGWMVRRIDFILESTWTQKFFLTTWRFYFQNTAEQMGELFRLDRLQLPPTGSISVSALADNEAQSCIFYLSAKKTTYRYTFFILPPSSSLILSVSLILNHTQKKLPFALRHGICKDVMIFWNFSFAKSCCAHSLVKKVSCPQFAKKSSFIKDAPHGCNHKKLD